MIAQKVNTDMARIYAMVATLLVVSATKADGTPLAQPNMHGEPSPAHTIVPWSNFHRISAMTARNIAAMAHAQTHNKYVTLAAAYGDASFNGKPSVMGIPA